MADFEQAFKYLMDEEGIKLSDSKADRGGQTYAGVSRKFHPGWVGWRYIDSGQTPPTQIVRDFYHAEYWMPIRGDEIKSQRIASVLLSQFANMGISAIKLAQAVAKVIQDGKIGAKTLSAINGMDEERFLDKLAIAMTARYYAIGMRDKSQREWWPGWLGRALRIAA